jgi:hypothetical protein
VNLRLVIVVPRRFNPTRSGARFAMVNNRHCTINQGDLMDTKSNSRKLTRSTDGRLGRTTAHDETPPDIDPTTARAYAQMVKVQEDNKTTRTWVICGTIVAGISIISYAALQQR